MNYPTRLLGEGETIEFQLRPHWRALIVPIIVLLGVVFVGTWAFLSWGAWFQGIVGTVGLWAIGIVVLVIFIVFVVRPFLMWITTQYVFTNRRIITRAGLVSKRGRDMPLAKVNNVSFEVSIVGRIFNFGRLEVESAGDEDLVINDVTNVEVIQREVYRLHEEDDERRRRRSAELGGDPVLPSDGT
jgi:uncharacterized membrane protein YdbT with pleckstrin-like domain